jgi:hypothetical protein
MRVIKKPARGGLDIGRFRGAASAVLVALLASLDMLLVPDASLPLPLSVVGIPAVLKPE